MNAIAERVRRSSVGADFEVEASAAARLAWRETLHALRRRRQGRRTIRIGVLGLGQVGQAFARLCAEFSPALARLGTEFRVVAALVRRPDAEREYRPEGAAVTGCAERFFAERLDVCVEALGGVEPAATHVARCLRAGIPVVTANKSLLAARGEELRGLARRHGVSLRGEASAIAGVPFLTTLSRRPAAARIARVTGVLNGTSHFLLGELERGATFPQALRAAQVRGLAEANPRADLSGRDAAEKLIVILQHLGVSGLDVTHLECRGIEWISPLDLRQAAVLGGVIKPVAFADVAGDSACGFVGPALLPTTHKLAGLKGVENGALFRTCDEEELLFAGPGAGPRPTAGTLFDDVVETVASHVDGRVDGTAGLPVRRLSGWNAPRTGWVVRLCCGRRDVGLAALLRALELHGLAIERGVYGPPQPEGDLVYIRTHPCSRERLERVLAECPLTRGLSMRTFRVLGDE